MRSGLRKSVQTPPDSKQISDYGCTIEFSQLKVLKMVVIRLSRGGSKSRPFFNVVVADSRNRRDGRFIERVGFYNPVAKAGSEDIRIALDRVTHWTTHGAQLSPTVATLVKKAGAKQAAAA